MFWLHLLLRCMYLPGRKAVGVRLAKRNSKQDRHEVIRADKAVISNASVWDTQKLLPQGAAPAKWHQESLATPMTGSFMHLHLGSALTSTRIWHSFTVDACISQSNPCLWPCTSRAAPGAPCIWNAPSPFLVSGFRLA